MVTEEELQNMSEEEIAELQKENCIFCKIIKGEVPSKQVYEDDRIVAILDIRPAKEGHVLVMPKEHYPVLPVIPEEVSSHMFKRTKDLCAAIRAGVPSTGTTVFMANGAAAGQQSPHFLYHIVPRDAGDGFGRFDLPQKNIDQSDLLEVLREKIGAAMKALLQRKGMMPEGQGQQEAVNQQLALMLEQNPEIKQLLLEDPDKFEELVTQNPQLQQVFQNIDIHQLSEKLKQGMSEQARPLKQSPSPQPRQEPRQEQEDGRRIQPSSKERTEKPQEDTGSDSRSETQEKEDEEADLDKVSRLFK